MNEKDIIKSISYIGEDIINEAEEKRAKSYFIAVREKRMRVVSIAASFLIFAIITPLISRLSNTDKSNTYQSSNDIPSLSMTSTSSSGDLFNIAPGRYAFELSAKYSDPYSENNQDHTTTGEVTTKNSVTSSFHHETTRPLYTTAPPTTSTLSHDYSSDISNEELYEILTRFSLNVFKNSLDQNGENISTAPLAALTALAMTANGTSGETMFQIEKAIGCDVGTLNTALLSYGKYLCLNDSPIKPAISLWIKNNKGLTVREDFLIANSNYYGAKIYSAPFTDLTKKEINNWCEYNTGGLIKNILREIDPSSAMLLINTIFFEAEWKNKYTEKNIINGFSFKNYDGSISNVTALESLESIYISSENATGFVKSCSDSRFSFALITPHSGIDIYEYAADLGIDTWNELWDSMENTDVAVVFPEFSTECETDLSLTMRRLGIDNIFSDENADLSRLGLSNDGNLFLSLFKQKTAITVDRNASLEGIKNNRGISVSGSLKKVNASNPFIYAIVDNDSGVPIFIGCIADLK